MKRSQWSTLSIGSFALGVYFSVYGRLVLIPNFNISRVLSMEGTSNLEVLSSLAWFQVNNLSLIFFVVGILLAICGWLEKKTR